MKNPVNVIRDLATRMSSARSALADVQAADQELRQAHAALQAERTLLIASPVPRAEVVAVAEAEVDKIGAEWRQAHAQQIVAALGGYVDLVPGTNTVRGVARGSLGPALPALDLAALCALLPEAMKNGIRRAIESAEYVEGAPMTDRPRLIRELDARIAEVEEEHSQLVDEATSVNVSLPLLPDVRMRRAQAATLAAQQEREEADRRRVVRG
jgi:hypothetical protein